MPRLSGRAAFRWYLPAPQHSLVRLARAQAEPKLLPQGAALGLDVPDPPGWRLTRCGARASLDSAVRLHVQKGKDRPRSPHAPLAPPGTTLAVRDSRAGCGLRQ